MELNINLNNQRNLKKGKKTFKILAIITVALSIATAIGLVFESTILLWFYAFYFLLLAISFYMQSGGKHLIDLIGKSYFKLTEEGVEYKLDMFNKKIHSFKWKDVEFISIKLFEIKVKVNNQLESINLEKLSDENLQLVKGVFKKHQSEIVEKDLILTDD